jgi:acetylornithine deacetylase/succinyl-diaminopimelate desuccinylase-like protein
MDTTVLSLCKRLIGYRSVTKEGTRAIAEICVRDLLAPSGIAARLIPSAREGPDQVNLLGTIEGRDHAAVPIVLNTHLDTVPPGDNALWTECGGHPFAATVSGDRIYGLGAADTKLDFVAKVMALVAGGKPRRDIYLAGTFGEEHGLVGAKEIVAAGLLPRGALAFVGEPSHLEVITAHKGLMVFELTVEFEPQRFKQKPRAARHAVFEGRAAHSSTPALGRNAIRAALAALVANPQLAVASIMGGDAVNRVPARCEVMFAGDIASSMTGLGASLVADREATAGAPRDYIPAQAIAILSRFAAALQQFADRAGGPEAGYAAPTLTCNPGVIRSAEGSIALEFELRPPPALALDVVRTGVAEIIASLTPGAPELKLALFERRANPGFRSTFEGETVELAMAALAQAGLAIESGVKAGCTEAGVYAAAGLRPVVFGPGPSTGVIHAPNEYNLLTEVDGAIRFYRELLQL